jgi:hypothetical protein
MRSFWYRGARADKTFVRVAFDSSDRHEGVLLSYDPSQQGLIELDSCSLPVHGNLKVRLRRDNQFAQ